MSGEATAGTGAGGGAEGQDLPMLQQDISNMVLLPCPFADYQTQLLQEPWQAGGETPTNLV